MANFRGPVYSSQSQLGTSKSLFSKLRKISFLTVFRSLKNNVPEKNPRDPHTLGVCLKLRPVRWFSREKNHLTDVYFRAPKIFDFWRGSIQTTSLDPLVQVLPLPVESKIDFWFQNDQKIGPLSRPPGRRRASLVASHHQASGHLDQTRPSFRQKAYFWPGPKILETPTLKSPGPIPDHFLKNGP